MKRCILVVLVLVVVFTALPTAQASAGSDEPKLFPETGHTLAYNFGVFYERLQGSIIFGLPITEVFLDQGYPVQYFERARLEWHAEVPEIRITDLGRWVTAGREHEPAFQSLNRQADDPIQRLSGHSLGGAFLGFYQQFGGWAIFGAPISEEFSEVDQQDGKLYTVQYFERARFEYHPEQAWPDSVALSPLGRQYLAAHPAPEQAVQPVRSADRAWAGLRITNVSIPRIGINVAVVERSVSFGIWDVPRTTVGHLWPISAFPGSPGNIILAGHANYRDTIFNHLPRARIGDDVLLMVGGAARRYIVREMLVVDTSATWALNPTPIETLTLITCTPEGDYSRRLIVHATPAPDAP